MATLALALMGGSAALVGGVFMSESIEKAPPTQTPPTVEYTPPSNTSVLSAPPPVPAPAPVPAPVPAPAPVQQGGAVGRPPWGIISSDTTVPRLPGSTTDTISAALGIKRNPKELQQEIIDVTSQYETAVFKADQLDEDINRQRKKFISFREKYILETAESRDAETTSNAYTKKITAQGQPNGNNNPEVQAITKRLKEEKNTLSKEEKDTLEAEKRSILASAVPVDDTKLAEWRKIVRAALVTKLTKEDDAKENKREMDKIDARITELRAKKEEFKKQAVELKAKRDALLVQLQTILISQEPKEGLFVDWPARTSRYAAAVKRYKLAETNLQQFHAETWKPLDNKPEQNNYREKLNVLTRVYDDARNELAQARLGLTSRTKQESSASSEFQQFAAKVTGITSEALDTAGKIKPEYEYSETNLDSRTKGYPPRVKELKEYAEKTNLQAVADMYYEISTLDTPGLVRNSQRFIDFFTKVKGTYTITPERVAGLYTKDILKEFVTKVLERAENSVRFFPRPAPEAEQNQARNVYAQLRTETGIFVDKQIFSIKKMLEVIRTARSEAPPTAEAGRKLATLDSLVSFLFTRLVDVPPLGVCQTIFTEEVYKTLSSGRFNRKDIMEILSDGGNPKDKEDFLNFIGFTKISTVREAVAAALIENPLPDSDAPDYLSKSALADYIQRFEDLVREDPTGRLMHVADEFRVISIFMGPPRRTIQQIRDASNQSLESAHPPGLGGNTVDNTTFLQDLKSRAQVHAFKPGVFLKTVRFPMDVNRNPRLDTPRVTSIVPISDFKEACELDANIGKGKANIAKINEILEKVEQMDIGSTVGKTPFEVLVAKLEANQNINMTRQDQAQPIDILGHKGFNNTRFADAVIMKVVSVKEKKDLNFLQAFLTLRSSKFRTIPYNDSIVYKGRTENTREVYAKVFMEELEKTSYFEARRDTEIASFPSDEDWGRLAGAYNLNIILFKEPPTSRGNGIADITYTNRVGAPTYYIFKAANGRYFPVRFQAVAAAVIPPVPGRNRRDVAAVLPPILGGSLDGPYIPVVGEDPPSVVQAKAAAKARAQYEARAKEAATSAEKARRYAAYVAKPKVTSVRPNITSSAPTLPEEEKPLKFTNPVRPRYNIEERYKASRARSLERRKAPVPEPVLEPVDVKPAGPETVAVKERGTEAEYDAAAAREENVFGDSGNVGLGGRKWKRSKPSRYTRRKI